MEISREDFLDTLPEKAVCISYSPHTHEPNPATDPLLQKEEMLMVPQDQTVDPSAFAEKIKRQVGGTAYILIPGTAFDIHGTRHGRGGGWYDRFLSKVPQRWMRVGVLYEKDLSATPLSREPWDEPVDCLAIHTTEGWKFFETGARPTDLK